MPFHDICAKVSIHGQNWKVFSQRYLNYDCGKIEECLRGKMWHDLRRVIAVKICTHFYCYNDSRVCRGCCNKELLLLICEGQLQSGGFFISRKISVSKATSMTRGKHRAVAAPTATEAPDKPAAATVATAAVVAVPRARAQSGSMSPRADSSILKTADCMKQAPVTAAIMQPSLGMH